MKAELVFDGCTFCFEVLFHVKDEEAAIHSPRLQEVLSLLLPVACTTDILLQDYCWLGYSVF